MAKIYIALEWFRAWKRRWRNFVGRQSVGHAWMVQSKALPARTLLLWDWKSYKSAVTSENRRYRVVGSIWWVIPSLITSPLRSPFVSISDHLAGHRIPVRGASVSALLSTGQIFQDTFQAQDPADKDVVSVRGQFWVVERQIRISTTYSVKGLNIARAKRYFGIDCSRCSRWWLGAAGSLCWFDQFYEDRTQRYNEWLPQEVDGSLWQG